MQSYSNEEIVKALRNWQVLLHEYARADKTKALIQMATTFLPFLALWVLMYFSLSWSYWITLGLGILNAFFLVRIFIIQHDCGHKSFFPYQLWNKIVGFTCSFFSTIPYEYWSAGSVSCWYRLLSSLLSSSLRSGFSTYSINMSLPISSGIRIGTICCLPFAAVLFIAYLRWYTG